MSKEILNKVEEIGDLLNMIHGNQPKADMAFYELQKLKELLQEEKPESACKWKPDYDEIYETKCGNSFYFDSSDLKEMIVAGFIYCPYCSKKIKEIKNE